MICSFRWMDSGKLLLCFLMVWVLYIYFTCRLGCYNISYSLTDQPNTTTRQCNCVTERPIVTMCGIIAASYCAYWDRHFSVPLRHCSLKHFDIHLDDFPEPHYFVKLNLLLVYVTLRILTFDNRGGSWPIVDSTIFLTIFYIFTIKFVRISTSTKTWKKAYIYNRICSNSTIFTAIFVKLISTFINLEILQLHLHLH